MTNARNLNYSHVFLRIENDELTYFDLHYKTLDVTTVWILLNELKADVITLFLMKNMEYKGSKTIYQR